ncbi:integrase, catalytic region, zinc finger, CCHC-type containing protein [Tanacetum coccineum]
MTCHSREYKVIFMNTIGMIMQQVQVNTKFLNDLPTEWSKFVTDVKLAKNMYTTNYDQLYAYLSQHEGHVNEVRMMCERYPDPLVLVAQYQTQSNSAQHGQSFASFRTKGNATILGGNNAAGQARVVKCYNYQGEGHMARQCTKPKRLRNSAWFKEKMLLVQAQESGPVLDEEQLAFLADPRIPDGQAIQITIPQNAAFQTDDLDAYDSDCDDISSAKLVLMANLSSYDSDVLSKVPQHDSYQNDDLLNQSVQETQNFEQSLIDYVLDTEITSDSNIISYEQYLQQTQNASVQDTNSSALQDSLIIYMFEQIQEKMIDSQMDDLIRDRCALKQEIDSLKQILSKQIKEKESLLQTFTVFKKESKEKENKNMDKEIDLEKKIKELDNIDYKVGQSAQTEHMLTKPQVFYDDTHKQALGYQNSFYLKKAQRIKQTLYGDTVLFNKHDVIFVVDEEETLILEEESR